MDYANEYVARLKNNISFKLKYNLLYFKIIQVDNPMNFSIKGAGVSLLNDIHSSTYIILSYQIIC